MFELFINPFFWLKVAILIIMASYTIFAFVVLNQIRAMDKIINLPPTKIIISVSVLNLIMGTSLFLLALALL